MKRLFAVLALIGAVALGGTTTAQAVPAPAAAPVASAQAAAAVPESWDWNWDWYKQSAQEDPIPATGWKMGGLPNHWTICVANGYGPTAEGLIENWNWSGFRLAVNVLNRCDGYSVTNRMTIDNFYQPGGVCIKYTRMERGNIDSQSAVIFTNNPVVSVNTASPCFDSNVELYHNIARGVGHVLGLHYMTVTCLCVMGATNYDITTTPYVTYKDAFWMNKVYD